MGTDTPGLEVTAFKMKNKDRYLVKCKWAVGFINRSREFVMDQDQTEWLITNLRPGEERRLLTHYRDELVRIGAWGVEVEAKAETKPTPLIAPPPSVVPGNTGPRKMETARMSEPKPKSKPKGKKKTEPKEPGLADMFALLSGMNATVQSLAGDVQSLSGRMDAVEEAATEPASAGAGPDF